MRKSTLIFILIVYLVSIIVIGFFGMSVKVYDEIKYVKSIEMSVQAENENMYSLKYTGKHETTYDNEYTLIINFSTHHLLDNEDNPYLPLSLIPYVVYDTGDVAGQSEKIKFKINSTYDLEANGYLNLLPNGQLKVYKEHFAFDINISPEKKGGTGTSAIMHVFVK